LPPLRTRHLKECRRRNPNVETIADAWRADENNYVEYFWQNRANDICTFQDNAIRVRLEQD
jgi:hypothetical protein